jgi:hypothetical protein|tara:strand:- start:178 stop:468 length:291 start_codon:yes stop_codon:yes gene_type:complete
MNLILLFLIQDGFEKLSEELNDADWNAFPIGEKYGIWIPIVLVIVVFFGFSYLTKIIENEQKIKILIVKEDYTSGISYYISSGICYIRSLLIINHF